ncbi:MAG: tetratricopeptide repeat protein [Pseudonocardiales bacterium]|jgi:hypothetical protein|nr:tetratricopeptide repeat protein [Pseudonocardiales bacterium]MBV9649453.1 tetratricopeptide repeat protein [Pseudonocardiales bacterium]
MMVITVIVGIPVASDGIMLSVATLSGPAGCHFLQHLGQHERAHQRGEDTLVRMRQALGNDHPYTVRSAAAVLTHPG